ncbi:MAG: hypothetical protein IPK11_09295 [Ignavibacteria bacterium]|nr:hypothetical protein [Ignavibacteria bacterium]
MKKILLFHRNSCRSQIAEALLRALYPLQCNPSAQGGIGTRTDTKKKQLLLCNRITECRHTSILYSNLSKHLLITTLTFNSITLYNYAREHLPYIPQATPYSLSYTRSGNRTQ